MTIPVKDDTSRGSDCLGYLSSPISPKKCHVDPHLDAHAPAPGKDPISRIYSMDFPSFYASPGSSEVDPNLKLPPTTNVSHHLNSFDEPSNLRGAVDDALQMDGFGPPPQVPPRHSSDNSNKSSNTNFWRQPLGVFLAFLFVLAVLFSTACLVRYALRDKAVYDQLVDYIDKTISISKINYNRALGLYEVTEQEQGALHQQRKYKNLIWAFLGSDLLNFVFFGAVIGLFYCANVNVGLPHSLFWIMLIIGIVYSLLQVSVFTALIFPLSARLPNETSTLLDHAIPHNPGGLLQMENSIGCTFDHNLYNAFQRRANPNNTCDPQIARSYIPRPLLLTFIALRLAALLVFAVSLLLRFSCGSLITALVEKTRGNSAYQTRFSKNPNPGKASGLHTPKSTTFGVKSAVGDSNPPATPPVNVDHTISYNNAAFLATNGLNSSRSSEISADIVNYRPPQHQSSSLISEV